MLGNNILVIRLGIYLLCLLFFLKANAQPNVASTTTGNPAEPKVDFLTRIYFSGENWEGLIIKMEIALQEIQLLQPTPALALQATFLLDIRENVQNAENSCEIIDLVAVGIYKLDPLEADKLGVDYPTMKAKTQTTDAVGNLDKLSSTSYRLSNSASDLAWSNYLLNGGSYNGFSQGAGRIGSIAGKAGNLVGGVAEGGRAVKDMVDLGKSLGLGKGSKEKPCKKVTPKSIAIGNHTPVLMDTVPAQVQAQTSKRKTNTTIINISGITYEAFRSFSKTLMDKEDVESIENSFNEQNSTLTVVHSGSTDALSDWIFEKFGSKFQVKSQKTGEIVLVTK